MGSLAEPNIKSISLNVLRLIMSSRLNMCFCVHNKQEDICECQCFEGQLTVIYTQSLLLCPQLEGVNEPVVLQVFVANDAGRVKPHGFYQACRVTGRNTTACKEVDIEGTTVIEIPLEPSSDMTLA